MLGLIEYQGTQHYEPTSCFSNKGKLQFHDKMKKEYCLKNNIPLLELNKESILYTSIMDWYATINSQNAFK